jgi:hypothetical protein
VDKERRTGGDWMQTWTGVRFYPLDPQPEDIDLGDIAHALSLLCRYGGHVDRFYSVAEHCILMSQAVASENALAALLHDATEAYVCDVPRPLKRYLPHYQMIEASVWRAIAIRFGISETLPSEVDVADSSIILTERDALMVKATPPWYQDGRFKPLPVTIEAWSPAEAEQRYLSRFAKLSGVGH